MFLHIYVFQRYSPKEHETPSCHRWYVAGGSTCWWSSRAPIIFRHTGRNSRNWNYMFSISLVCIYIYNIYIYIIYIYIYHRIVPIILFSHCMIIISQYIPFSRRARFHISQSIPMKWLVSTAKIHESNHVKATKNPKVCPPLSKLVYKPTSLQLVRSPTNIYKPSLAYIVLSEPNSWYIP